MIDSDLAPLAAEAEHGRLRGDLLLLHSIDPTTSAVNWINVVMTTVVVVVAVIALFRHARFRSAALALTQMLTVLAPLLAAFAAAASLFSVLLDRVDPDPADVGGMPLALAEAVFVILFGALAGAVGAVLTAVLRIMPVRSPLKGGDTNAAGSSNLSET